MPKKTSTTGSELFIVDNSEQDWKVLKYLNQWCEISSKIDIATAFFEIGSSVMLVLYLKIKTMWVSACFSHQKSK